MPINKIVSSFDEAVADIEDGATIMVGGFGVVAGAPSLLLEAVARKGVKELTMVSNVCGFGKEVWKQLGFKFAEDPDILVRNGQLKKAIATAPVSAIYENNFERLLRAGKVELEMASQGSLAERIRAAKAGLGGIYTPVGIGTVLEEGKETKVIDGKKYILELPIKADFALIKAHKGDRWGNLVYRRTSRNFNAIMAGAATVTIAEVDEIVELGELDADVIHTPGPYVDRVVVRPKEIDDEDMEISDKAKESYEKFQKKGG
ncbi:MAG: 3-oxoacid CoA-transferase subunit A [Chloroflexi bacterium]|nr:3-oxoacid CoA-transferase subunit A [Chloroflexota bacterium]